jgi:hypothetical protein
MVAEHFLCIKRGTQTEIFEKKVVRRIFGLRRDEETGSW